MSTRTFRASLLSVLLIVAATARVSAAATPTGESACEYAARVANRGKLEEAVSKGRPWNDTSLPRQPESLGGGVTFRDRIDINGDGRPEYVNVPPWKHRLTILRADRELGRKEERVAPGRSHLRVETVATESAGGVMLPLRRRHWRDLQ